MFRKPILMLTMFIAGIYIMACSGKKEGGEDHAHEHAEAAGHEEWKEMDDFHMIMAESFHPFKDSANLAPAKARAAEMASAAEKWASAPIPEKANHEVMEEKLQKLKTETAAFTSTVAAGDDKAIGESLTGLHDLFHEIQETWYGKGHHHDHEH